jgi:hypothetical protein
VDGDDGSETNGDVANDDDEGVKHGTNPTRHLSFQKPISTSDFLWFQIKKSWLVSLAAQASNTQCIFRT